MNAENGPTVVRLRELGRPDRMRIYWGCYWRALLFVVAQIVVMIPVYFLLTFGSSKVVEGSLSQSVVVAVVGETCSVVFGFVFVAAFVRMIEGRSIGRTRFVLVQDDVKRSALANAA